MNARRFSRSIILALAVAGVGYTFQMANAQPKDPPSNQPIVQAVPDTQDVPVGTVVLFSSGVGYFEHTGQVFGDGSTELRFKAGQINDILKSLVLQDLDGGKVSSVTYPSLDPVEKTLRSFQVDITGNPPLSQLLNQLRGAKVTVQFGGEKVSGTILGVEEKTTIVKEQTITRHVMNLLNGAMIKSIELEELTDLQLEDVGLQEELAKALAALAQSRDQDKKPVTISFTGKDARRVRIGYVVETPVWKTSYRLILSDNEEKPKLQGWAIVENQTDNDWKDVSLSLVSGRPISFVMDLYSPLYIPRPVVQPELYASLRPQMYEDGMMAREDAGAGGGAADEMRRAQKSLNRAGMSAGAPMAAEAAMPQLAARDRNLDFSQSVQSVANAEKIGELFSYTVSNVTLPRQKSAMLPIITDEVTVEKLSIYNAAVLAKNPLNGARLTNSTDKHLLTGPITVLEAGTYAGDARIDNVPPGQNRLLSYGIDLQMRVDSTKNSNSSSVMSGKISEGILHVQRKFVNTQSYQAENKADKSKMLLVEHPLRQGWKLVDSPKPEETTEALYRFKTPVEAGKSASLTVKEELISTESITILPMDVEQVLAYSQTGEISKEVRDALVKAADYKRSLNASQRQIAEISQRLNAVAIEQNRIRENMKTVENKSEYYTRLLKKLNEQETQIEQMQTQRDGLQEKMEQQRVELETYLKSLSIG